MEQHPVPQHIASFQFKLFGNLTSKQFITLAIPLGLAALIYFSPLPTIIRLPVSFIIGVFSFVIALVPVGGKSADQWAIAFFKALASPTQRIWIKEKEIPEFLNIVVSAPQSENIPEEVKRMSKTRLLAYLRSLPKESESSLDVKEQMELGDIDFAYQEPSPPPQIVRFKESPVPISTPKLQGEEPTPFPAQQKRTKLKETKPAPEIKEAGKFPPSIIWPGGPVSTYGGNYNFQVLISPSARAQSLPAPQAPQAKIALHARPYILPGVEKRLSAFPLQQESQMMSSAPFTTAPIVPAIKLASETNFSIDNIIPIRTPDNRIKLVHGIGKTRARKLHFAPPVGFDLSKLPIRGEKRFELTKELKRFFQIDDGAPPVVLPTQNQNKPNSPDSPKIPITKTYHDVPQKTVQIAKSTHPAQVLKVKSLAQSKTVQKQNQPVFVPRFAETKEQKGQNQAVSAASIVPLTNTINVISGLVTDSVGSSIPGAVLVIRDERGIPVRALKTNKLGQFLSATPLNKGEYSIETESQNYQFKVVRLIIEDKVITPLHIQAEKGPVTN